MGRKWTGSVRAAGPRESSDSASQSEADPPADPRERQNAPVTTERDEANSAGSPRWRCDQRISCGGPVLSGLFVGRIWAALLGDSQSGAVPQARKYGT